MGQGLAVCWIQNDSLFRDRGESVEDNILHAKIYFNMPFALKTAGADVTTTAVDFEPYVVEGRELITGQNPRSDHPIAAKFIAALDRKHA
jgi:putative intracellular protease/amidase